MVRCLAWIGMLAVAGCAAGPPTELEQRVRGAVESWRAEYGFPGVVVAFSLADGRLGAVASGATDELGGRPLREDDRMLSGSIGKTYVAAVVLQLVDEGVLALDGGIAGSLGHEPWFERLPNADTLTVRSLLNHTSGIREHVWSEEFRRAVGDDPDRVWTNAERLAFVLDTEPLSAVGAGWWYADTNYIVLGAVVEAITGERFDDVLQRRVLDRYDLDDTVPSDRRRIPGLVQGHSALGRMFGFGNRTLDAHGTFAINPQFEGCGGGLASSAPDLARWARAWGSLAAVVDELRDDVIDGVDASMLGAGTRYGLGMILRDTPLGSARGHSGVMPGYLAAMAYYPDHDLAVAMQWNTDDPRRLGGRPEEHVDRFAELLVARER